MTNQSDMRGRSPEQHVKAGQQSQKNASPNSDRQDQGQNARNQQAPGARGNTQDQPLKTGPQSDRNR